MFNLFLKKTNLLNLTIGILIVVVVALVVFRVQSLVLDKYFLGEQQEEVQEEIKEESDISAKVMTMPEFTEDIKTRLESSNGFDFLVSYKDQGFEPFNLDVEVGDTVRFTNNSSEKIKLLNTDSSGTNQTADCSGDDFSVCRIIDIGDFWEITFTEAGVKYYTNGDRRGGVASIITVNSK